MKSRYKLIIKGIALLGIVGLLTSCGGGGGAAPAGHGAGPTSDSGLARAQSGPRPRLAERVRPLAFCAGVDAGSGRPVDHPVLAGLADHIWCGGRCADGLHSCTGIAAGAGDPYRH